MSVKQEAQIAMFDRTIENPELEEAIERMKDAEDGAKQYAAARKPVKKMIENMALTDGERVRVGRFVITVKARSGGGFEVPPWSKVLPGKITELVE